MRRLLPGLAALTLGCSNAQHTGPPNIILVSLDGLRADRAGAYGNPNRPTPTLDRLAADGLRWEHAFSQSNESLFSHAALLVGRQVPEIATPDYHSFVVPQGALLVSELLASHGYTTAAFVAGGHVHGAYGFDQGFSVFDGSHDFGAFFHKTPQALAWVDEQAREPFFLFLHGYDCHRPYFHPGPWYHAFDDDYRGDVDEVMERRTATERVYEGGLYRSFPLRQFEHPVGDPIVDPDGYARIARWAEEHEPDATLDPRDLEHLRAHYDSGALAADLQVGMFLEDLDARGLLDNTWVILTADHGEDLGDHGFFNHRALLRDSTTRVPLVLWRADQPEEARGLVRQDLAQALDVVPTILGLAGIISPVGLPGRDLRSDAPAPERIFQVGVGPQVSVRSATHRLVFSGVPPASPLFPQALAAAPLEPEWFQLFDLGADPTEQVDVVSDQTDAALEERLALLTWYQALRLSTHRGEAPVDPALLETLRSRGYW